MRTYAEIFLSKMMSGQHRCGTCGGLMIPPKKLLDKFFDWLAREGKILTNETVDEIKRLSEKNSELLNENDVLRSQVRRNG